MGATYMRLTVYAKIYGIRQAFKRFIKLIHFYGVFTCVQAQSQKCPCISQLVGHNLYLPQAWFLTISSIDRRLHWSSRQQPPWQLTMRWLTYKRSCIVQGHYEFTTAHILTVMDDVPLYIRPSVYHNSHHNYYLWKMITPMIFTPSMRARYSQSDDKSWTCGCITQLQYFMKSFCHLDSMRPKAERKPCTRNIKKRR